MDYHVLTGHITYFSLFHAIYFCPITCIYCMESCKWQFMKLKLKVSAKKKKTLILTITSDQINLPLIFFMEYHLPTSTLLNAFCYELNTKNRSQQVLANFLTYVDYLGFFVELFHPKYIHGFFYKKRLHMVYSCPVVHELCNKNVK